jgi:hypothetical protein
MGPRLCGDDAGSMRQWVGRRLSAIKHEQGDSGHLFDVEVNHCAPL